MERPTKQQFVRDIMRGLDERKCDRKESMAQAIINEPCGYYSNKLYARGKKHTKQAYQC